MKNDLPLWTDSHNTPAYTQYSPLKRAQADVNRVSKEKETPSPTSLLRDADLFAVAATVSACLWTAL